MAVSKRLRYEILRRDNHTCRYCGDAAPDVTLTVDHVIPTALGGTDQPDNLVTACTDCNAGKAASNPDQPLVDDVGADALRWGEAMKRAAEHQRQQIRTLRQYADDLAELWTIEWAGILVCEYEPDRGWHHTSDPERTYPFVVNSDEQEGIYLADTEDDAHRWIKERERLRVPPLPDDWDASVSAWHAAGVTYEDHLEAVRITKRADYIPWESRYRYFCGVIWKRIERRQDIARSLIEADQDEA